MEKKRSTRKVFTLGHSNREIDEFTNLLKSQDITELIDVRSYPSSRRHPHFNEGNLEQFLREADIGYEHWPELGGYRDPRDNSQNTALPGGFKAVADHLNTTEGRRAINQLTETIVASDDQYCLMCAEKNPDRCHRKLIADHLTARGWSVYHLLAEGELHEHELHPNARLEDDSVTYPGLV